jgi:hypothetical protein
MELDYWRQKYGVQDQKLDDLAHLQLCSLFSWQAALKIVKTPQDRGNWARNLQAQFNMYPHPSSLS